MVTDPVPIPGGHIITIDFADTPARTRRAVPGIEAALAGGDLSLLLGWLRRNVHGVGSRLTFNELLQAATGKPLDPTDFQAHLTARYLA